MKNLDEYVPNELAKSSPPTALTELTFPIHRKINLREAFLQIHKKLGFEICFSQIERPQYLLRDRQGNFKTGVVVKHPANLVNKRNFLKSFDIIICWSDATDFEKRLLNTSDITIIELKDLVKAPYKKSFVDPMVETKLRINMKNIGEELILRKLYKEGIQGEATVRLCLTPLRKEIQEHIGIELSRQRLKTIIEFLSSAHEYPFHEISNKCWTTKTKQVDILSQNDIYAKIMRKKVFQRFEDFGIVNPFDGNFYPQLPWSKNERDNYLVDPNKESDNGRKENFFNISPEKTSRSPTCSDKEFDVTFPILYEVNVREVFSRFADKLDYVIVSSRERFPDYTVKNAKEELLRAEVELQPVHFRDHGHSPKHCDVVICWMDDHYGHKLKEEGVQVLALNKYVAAPLGSINPQSKKIQRRKRIRKRRNIGASLVELVDQELAKKQTPIIRLKDLTKLYEEKTGETIQPTTVLNFFTYDSSTTFRKIHTKSGTCLYFPER